MNDSALDLKAVRQNFGTQLRFLRLQAELSQEDLANKCGLDRTYVGGIERGERNPSLVNIARLAEALKVPPSKLFEPAAPVKRER